MMKKETFMLVPIGTIYTPYTSKEQCPVQGAAKPEGKGRVELFPEYADGLETIESFSHLYLFYVFHRAGEVILSRPTFLDHRSHGVFASRHPCRPNGIGMSIVRLEGREENILYVSEVDMLNQTPLIDIKPLVPKFDHRPGAGNGWLESRKFRKKPPGRE